MMEELFFLEAIIVEVFTNNDFFFFLIQHSEFFDTRIRCLVAVVLIYILSVVNATTRILKKCRHNVVYNVVLYHCG